VAAVAAAAAAATASAEAAAKTAAKSKLRASLLPQKGCNKSRVGFNSVSHVPSFHVFADLTRGNDLEAE
jgi:hypothetical protein